MFDVKVMVFFGVLGYLLKKWGLSPAALLIAFILGPMAEVYLRQGLMMSGGDPSIFFTRPIALLFFLLSMATVLWTAWRRRSKRAAQV